MFYNTQYPRLNTQDYLEMSNVQLIYEQYQVLSQKPKNDFFEILRQERASKKSKHSKPTAKL